jgi:hypothetical protein
MGHEFTPDEARQANALRKTHGAGGNRPYKLSPEQVMAIRERLAKGEQGTSLARAYGVHKSIITRIKYNQR